MKMTIGRKVRHYINPMNLTCKLYNAGVPIQIAKNICLRYEQFIFNPCIRKFDDEKPSTGTCPGSLGNPSN